MIEDRRKTSDVRLKMKSMVISLLLLAGMTTAGPAHAMLTAKANHDHITIDFFYHGSTVSVKGLSDPGRDLVIKIASPESHQMMKKKGKVAGTLWMNVGKLAFENTPNLYEVFSTKAIDSILTRDEQQKFVLGYPALANHAEIDPVTNETEKKQWFNEFVKYKEDSNLYVSKESTIETTTLPDGHQQYSVMTQWPYQAAPGEYIVTVYAVKDGKVVEQAESHVKVEQVGMVKTLATMAKNSAAFYGILSVGIALSAGFGVGLIFRKGGGAH